MDFFIIYALGFLLVLVVIGFCIALFSEKKEKGAMFGALDSTLFLVLMPKNDSQKEGQGQQQEKQIISQMEQVLANFLYLKKPKMFQEAASVSLEIASKTGGSDISFYMAVPTYLEGAFEKHVQGVFPKAVVEKVPDDYTVFQGGGQGAGAFLTLKENFLFPISTYQKLEKDPLTAITNSLSKIAHDEGAAVQVMIRPVSGVNVRKSGDKVLSKIREGQPAGKAILEVMGGGGFGKAAQDALKTVDKEKEKEKKMEEGRGGYSQADYEAIQGKIQKQPFETVIRLVASSPTIERSEDILQSLISAFSQYSFSSVNSFKANQVKGKQLKKFIYEFVFRIFNEKQSNILNIEEISSIYHFPLNFNETPYITSSKTAVVAPPADLPETGPSLIGKVLFRGEEKKVYFASKPDRLRHMYVIGQTGTGKSGFMEGLAIQDIINGEGVAIVDPHGEFVEHVLANIPKERVDDVVIFEPHDLERPMGLNMLEYDTPEQKDFAVQEMISIFYKLFPPEIIGPMFEHYMRNAMLALMADKDNPGTLVEIPKMFTDPAFLQEKLKKVTDPVVRQFWVKEWAATTGSTRSDMLGYVVSKVGRFIENEMMRNIIGQAHSAFDLSKIMDEKKIFLANLSKGQTGEVNSSLLGLILVSKIQMAAMRRASMEESKRQDFYLYIDEFQNFTTDSISTILSEARKYKLGLIMAHQFIKQLDDKISAAVFGNVGTMCVMRVGADDAEFLEKQFAPEFSAFDMVNMDNFTMMIKMMLNNKISSPFKMGTIAPSKGNPKIVDAIKQISKLKYGKPKALVEQDIFQRSFMPTAPLPPQKIPMSEKQT